MDNNGTTRSASATLAPKPNLLSLPVEVRQMVLKEVMGVCSLRSEAIQKLKPWTLGSSTNDSNTDLDSGNEKGESIDIDESDFDEFMRVRQLSQICSTVREDMKFLEPQWLQKERAHFDVVQFEDFIENASSREKANTNAVVLDLKLNTTRDGFGPNSYPDGIWKYFTHQAYCPDNCRDLECRPKSKFGFQLANLRWWEVLMMKLPQQIKYIEYKGNPSLDGFFNGDLEWSRLAGLVVRAVRHDPNGIVVKQSKTVPEQKENRHEYMPRWMQMEHKRVRKLRRCK